MWSKLLKMLTAMVLCRIQDMGRMSSGGEEVKPHRYHTAQLVLDSDAFHPSSSSPAKIQ
jgi:hypothetical protein